MEFGSLVGGGRKNAIDKKRMTPPPAQLAGTKN